jgi:hypothetical protein
MLGSKIDMWSIGMVAVYMQGYGHGYVHEDCMYKSTMISITSMLGMPDNDTWKTIMKTLDMVADRRVVLKPELKTIIEGLLEFDQEKRLSATQAIQLYSMETQHQHQHQHQPQNQPNDFIKSKVNNAHAKIVKSWMCKVCIRFKLSSYVLLMSLHLFDRICTIGTVCLDTLQLHGVASMYIMDNLLTNYPAELRDYYWISDKSCPPMDIQKCVAKILTEMDDVYPSVAFYVTDDIIASGVCNYVINSTEYSITDVIEKVTVVYNSDDIPEGCDEIARILTTETTMPIVSSYDIQTATCHSDRIKYTSWIQNLTRALSKKIGGKRLCIL